MPDRARVEAFIAAVVGGDHVEAIADYYHDDAFMQENLKDPRRGRGLLMEHEANALKRLKQMHTHPNPPFAVNGDDVFINWTFDATGADGVTRRLIEVAHQRWQGDRILEERFYYDTATAFRPI